MAWTEPGKNKGSPESGPPDLDQLVGQLIDKIKAVFTGKNSPQRGSKDGSAVNASTWIAFVIGGLLLIWALAGIFIVSPAEQGIVLQFGRYQKTVEPGPHWIPRLINSKVLVNIQKISTYSYSSQMLTKDQNIVDVSVAVQYRIADPKAFLFGVSDPVKSLQEATASALRQVIGNTTLDDVLTTGRAAVRDAVTQHLNEILAIYQTGIVLTDVALQPAKAPDQVKDAFDDAIKAQEDEQRYINQAEAYAKQVVPVAQGQAKRIYEEAEAYRQQVVLTAQGDVAGYLSILPVYRNAPEVTRKRMYLTAIEKILANTPKVLMDAQGNAPLFYLPLEKWMGSAPVKNTDLPNESAQNSNTAPTQSTQPENNTMSRQDRPQRFAFVNPDSEIGSSGGRTS